MNYPPKPKFLERLGILLKNKEDINKFIETSKTPSLKSVRVNTLKISSENLIEKLKNKNWKIHQPFKDNPEIIQIKSQLKPGELGNSIEHLLGYYYVQEITSMMPILALNPRPDDLLLDLCASPGSKTTQAASLMNNQGTIIANDVNLGRVSILSANLERCGITNAIITKHPGNELAEKLEKLNMRFDKILIDAPCSGEGNIRCSPKTLLEWSEGLLKNLSKKQKRIASSAIPLLKEEGEIIYSTCTHSPEENEIVVQHLLDNFPLKIIPINLPLKTRPGLLKWKNQEFSEEMKDAVRIYHHDNNLEGFFLCKMKLK
jgi:NOL1/NOP2/sun family putative RNA methylase